MGGALVVSSGQKIWELFHSSEGEGGGQVSKFDFPPVIWHRRSATADHLDFFP